jgi:hypothetical protein
VKILCTICRETFPSIESFMDHRLSMHLPLKRAPERLESAAATFRGRNATYGDTYNSIGGVLLAFFQDGLLLTKEGDFRRFSTFLQCVNKLHRYAATFVDGGHLDSAHDLIVYAAMLEEQTQPKKETNS